MAESTDLMIFDDITAVATRPKELDPSDKAGTEGFEGDRIRWPRIGIAQALSHQMLEGDPLRIKDLKMYEMFNDLTGEIYGRGPLTFVPIKRMVKAIHWRPLTEGGGMIDPDVPLDDERLEWRRDPDGDRTKDQPPLATRYEEYVVFLLRKGRAPESIVLSIACTNKFNQRAADLLWLYIKSRQAAIYSGLYTIDTLTPVKNDKNQQFGAPTINNSGFIPVATPVGKALFDKAKDLHDNLSDKVIEVQREPAPVDDASFNTQEFERTK